MFNIGVGELLIVLVVAFVIVGPDDLPKVARWLGRQVRRLRTMIKELKAETGWDELEKEVRSVQSDVKDTARSLDVTADIKGAVKDVRTEVRGISKDLNQDFGAINRDLKEEMKTADEGVRSAAKAKDKPGDAQSNDKEEIQ